MFTGIILHSLSLKACLTNHRVGPMLEIIQLVDSKPKNPNKLRLANTITDWEERMQSAGRRNSMFLNLFQEQILLFKYQAALLDLTSPNLWLE